MNGTTLRLLRCAALQVAEMVAAVGSAFVKLGLEPGARVGVLGANSKEWMMGMQVGGCWHGPTTRGSRAQGGGRMV